MSFSVNGAFATSIYVTVVEYITKL
jgi:hypothetical protein